tara:strand:+ start:21967 stop:22380 length:414 start_codon:yes stop_codon:yes gene_type:complete
MKSKPMVNVVFAIVMLAGGAFNSFAQAGEADVVGVSVTRDSQNTYRFSVMVAHDDSGWDHYADAWQVIGPDGAILGQRILAHPHENEQPFTRSLSGVEIPASIESVTIRARDLVHGFGGAEVTVRLPGMVGDTVKQP